MPISGSDDTGARSAVASRSVADAAFPGDLNPGDVISLPDMDGDMVVDAVRLGQGGFVLTVSAPGSEPGAERVITLTAGTRVSRRGKINAR